MPPSPSAAHLSAASRHLHNRAQTHTGPIAPHHSGYRAGFVVGGGLLLVILHEYPERFPTGLGTRNGILQFHQRMVQHIPFRVLPFDFRYQGQDVLAGVGNECTILWPMNVEPNS